MIAIEVIKHIGVIPMSIERPCTVPSNGELRRWFTQKAIVINGKRPSFNEEIKFPIKELIFFPSSKSRITTVI